MTKDEALKPCRSPYCECAVGQCSHPGCYDARHEEFTPPAAQRQWVGLTPHERTMCRSYDPDEAVAKTEAKLKEKNT
jgi:hypothetical protein